ncbi:nucleotidyltransferase family protein [Kineothrix sp. MB12-C1]|uniref:nucleotidyltransferase family protein n=1 Tax=Kineothrix sp. MB12-C1 TaxID=3070215 RepID=UPI0027D2FC13|nr:nucleotidyltransferase domain-containing protein [Kineothrix sp. MB12-C1]WMC93378.1 nucleotidyltransferase domain-containing protein [Kineothrix sp. MB12-C1]
MKSGNMCNRQGVMNMLTYEMTQELISGLIDIFNDNIYQIILYGSVARQQATEESDIDIAIVLNNNFDSEIRERFIAWATDMDLKYGKIFSIIDIERKNLGKWGKVLPFYRSIQEEGIVLWKVA